MENEHFCNIKSKLDSFKFSSMNYIEYEDICNYEVQLENDNIILLYGFNPEAKLNEYHWATNKLKDFIACLYDKNDFLITFIPNEWVAKLEKLGFIIRNAWHDYFMNSLDNINISDEFDFLTIDRCNEASEITILCKNQSRGFTGQTTEWMKDWINNNEEIANSTGIRNKAVLIEKNINDEIIAILCVATYAHESVKGPIVWIREVAVNPSYQNKGTGRKLIMKALSYGKNHNATRAFLSADECNNSGIHLYTSIGFLPSDEKSQIDMLK